MSGRKPGFRRYWIATVAAALGVLVPAAEPAAQTLCSKPLQPLCSTQFNNLADETERLRCQADIESFIEELRNYQACLAGSLESAEEALKSAEGFRDCINEGRTDCGLDADSKL